MNQPYIRIVEMFSMVPPLKKLIWVPSSIPLGERSARDLLLIVPVDPQTKHRPYLCMKTLGFGGNRRWKGHMLVRQSDLKNRYNDIAPFSASSDESECTTARSAMVEFAA